MNIDNVLDVHSQRLAKQNPAVPGLPTGWRGIERRNTMVDGVMVSTFDRVPNHPDRRTLDSEPHLGRRGRPSFLRNCRRRWCRCGRRFLCRRRFLCGRHLCQPCVGAGSSVVGVGSSASDGVGVAVGTGVGEESTCLVVGPGGSEPICRVGFSSSMSEHPPLLQATTQ